MATLMYCNKEIITTRELQQRQG